MAEVLGAVTSATKIFLEVNRVSIDNWNFKLFYKASTSLLLACSVLSSFKQFFGDPISCDLNIKGGVNRAVLNSYCWMYSTMNIPPAFKGSCAKKEHDGATLYNSYYQFVSIFLVLQAGLFYAPRYVWLMLEGGLMKFLARGARGKIVEDPVEKRESLIRTFQEHLHNKYNAYAAGFFACEAANLIVTIMQIFLTNKFLSYNFLGYGVRVWAYYSQPAEERRHGGINPMCETFPRLVSCDYVRYGFAGGKTSLNAICILALNMINDKIFLVLWLWYFVLLFIGFYRFVYRIVQISSARVRFQLMKVKMHRYFKTNASTVHIQHYILNCSIGDWFVLYQMSRNLNRKFFADFITVLSKRVNPDPDIECDETPLVKGWDLLKGSMENKSACNNLDITFGNNEDDQDKETKIPGPNDIIGF